ncbi:MAG: hypothetical protein FJ284_15215 [Planctomycetes bacterium]|nr:hypothetical protein [Planctomycetota bacterium]
MLVITSNWALSDGSLTPARAGRGLVRIEAIRRAVARGGWGHDGRYRPLAGATVVFAGDTFDWLCSDIWAGRDRPWHTHRRAGRARLEVAVASVLGARSVLRTLRRWSHSGIPVPAADARGRPASVGRAMIPVRPVVLAGDRDWWLPELATVADRLGILVGESWSDGVRGVRHGCDLDPLARGDGRRGVGRPTLGESLTVDLIVLFAVAARAAPGLWALVRPTVGRLCQARPSTLPERVESLLLRSATSPSVRTRLVSLWRRHVAQWHVTARREPPACDAEFEPLDDLADWFDRLDPLGRPPASVAALDDRCVVPAAGAIVGHLAGPDGPVADCHSPVGDAWREYLDAGPPGPAVIVVGAADPGGGFVDAA